MAILTTDQSNYEDIADAIREKNGTGETYLPSEMAGAIRNIHGDVTGVKGDAESNYRTGNVNLTPANIGAKATQTPVASPTASGTAVAFIDGITQNAQGVITPTKKSVRTATASQSGLMSAADKGNLDNLQTRMTAAEDEMDILAVYPTASGRGALVTIEGTVDAPPAEMVIYGRSVQDGTPAPDAPAAIVTAGSGGTLTMVSAGKNLFTRPYYRESVSGSGPYAHNGVTFTLNSDGSITANGTAAGGNAFYNLSNINQQTHVLPAGAYTISGGIDASKYVYVRNADSSVSGGAGAQPATITLPSTSAINAVVMIEEGATCNNDIFWPQIECGSTATGYAAPISNAVVAIPTEPNDLPGIPVDSGGNYTDTDGQRWLCDTIDLEAGTWTKRVETYTVTGSESISKSSESAVDTYLLYFPTGTPDLVKGNTAFLCSHFRASGATAVGNAEIPTTGNYLRMRCHYAGAGTSTVEAFTAAITGMTVVYALAAPVVTQLTEAQITALRALRGRKGLTNLYSADPAGPEFRADMYIDIPTYIQSVIKKPLSLYDLNITPGTWNNIHPDFDPETEEYAVTLRKGNAATVNAVVIGTTATVTFDTIGGARTYFTMSTSSSAVGDRKTYSCEVNPFAAGVGGGLVMTVTKGNLSRRYYLSITSVE